MPLATVEPSHEGKTSRRAFQPSPCVHGSSRDRWKGWKYLYFILEKRKFRKNGFLLIDRLCGSSLLLLLLFFSFLFFFSEGRQKKSAKEKIRYGVTQRIGIFAFVSERGPISYRADLPNILYNRDNKIPTAPFTINREKKYKVSFFSDTNFKLEFVEILSRMLTNLRD